MISFNGYYATQAAFVLAVSFALAAAGCGAPPAAARHVVEVSTLVLLEADEQTAVRYSAAAASALEASATIAEYRAAMAPWDALHAALSVAQSTILVMDNALDAWAEGGAGRWLGMLPCLVGTLGDIRDALRAVGLPVPAELESVISMAADFGNATCARTHEES